uniref:Uncharacterized protein n=1 Tax=Magallana gigas TaxID=29159 RepID=K1P6A3_MAGGI
MAFPRPLSFGGPVGTRPTHLKENGGECSVCGLVPRTGYLIARDFTTGESAQQGFYRMKPASEDKGHVLDAVTGKSSGNPRILSVIVTEKY